MYSLYEFVNEFFYDPTNQPMKVFDNWEGEHIWEGRSIWEIPEHLRNFNIYGISALDDGYMELVIDTSEND